MSNDIEGSYLNVINYLAPIIVVSGEVYAFHYIENLGLAFVGAFFAGGFLFPAVLCINLTIALFAKDT
ncbi:hypothetical protein [Ferrimonas sp.]|uniref:hypothetical protein n=1 Tax=Ferrimonas sp. TaxID=2080861 RepID=UPI003A8CB0D3